MLSQSLAAALLLFCHGTPVGHAAELGNIRVHSWLGQQLKASVALTGDDARESEARCYKATLVNLNQEVVSNMKVTLQHSSKTSVLLLAGGNAVEEPAVTVVVENACDAGARKEFQVLLDMNPEPPVVRTVVQEDAASTAPAAIGAEKQLASKAPAARKAAAVEPKTAFLSRMHEATGMKLVVMLGNVEAGSRLRTALAASVPVAKSMESSRMQDLKLERNLVQVSVGTSSGSSRNEGISLNAVVAITLSILAIAAAAAWLIMRIRAMRSVARPWVPVDALPDAGNEPSTAAARAQG